MVKKLERSSAYNLQVTLAVCGLAILLLVLFLLVPANKPANIQESASAGGLNMVTVRVMNTQGELSEPFQTAKVIRTEEEWKQRLTPEQYRVTRNSGTERAFCGNLLDNKKEGVYTCVCCRLPLFSSNAKFNSGTGWPSFFQPICKENVSEKADNTHGMIRVEINCARCDAHLGHVFDDGPPPTQLRFCLNSESLEFTEKESLAKLAESGGK